MDRPSPPALRRSSAVRPRPIALPRPSAGLARTGLGTALRRRQTIRELSDRPFTRQLLSNLLWAACGVNRRSGPFGLLGRTAASASNSQEVDVYVALREATYLYDAARHQLLPIASGDLRPFAIGRGQSRLGYAAPVRLIFVADRDKLENSAGFMEPGLKDPDVQRSYYYVDAGLIAQNVYLFAAASRLGAWFHNCDHEALHGRLRLRAGQVVLFGQTVGYPEPAKQRARKASAARR